MSPRRYDMISDARATFPDAWSANASLIASCG
jgi:hypothetical protein